MFFSPSVDADGTEYGLCVLVVVNRLRQSMCPRTMLLTVAFGLAVLTICTLASVNVKEKSVERKLNNNGDLLAKHEGLRYNYLRLADGECHNCSTYKCTNHTSNLGGSEWCIMLFPAAIAHCDSDPNCGGYTMTTAEWFHTKYDKNGQIAVHLTKAGEKPFACFLSEWSSYAKQHEQRQTPLVYGKTTCDKSAGQTCDQLRNFDYVFVSESKGTNGDVPYLCNEHPHHLETKDLQCLLPINEAIHWCNQDQFCQGYLINTDEKWQKKINVNGMPVVQLVGEGLTATSDPMWRSFKKQH